MNSGTGYGTFSYLVITWGGGAGIGVGTLMILGFGGGSGLGIFGMTGLGVGGAGSIIGTCTGGSHSSLTTTSSSTSPHWKFS